MKGYAWQVHFADGWYWPNEKCYHSMSEVFRAVINSGFPWDAVCVDEVQDEGGWFSLIKNVHMGEKIAYWVNDEEGDAGGWVAR